MFLNYLINFKDDKGVYRNLFIIIFSSQVFSFVSFFLYTQTDI